MTAMPLSSPIKTEADRTSIQTVSDPSGNRVCQSGERIHVGNAGSAVSHWNKKHGYASPGNPTYVCWWSMRQRCEYAKHKSYSSYGGRGIRVCEEWRLFVNFLRDMGERPKGMTLGRVDNHGPYAAWNCRWETVKEQNNNRRSSRFLTAFGKTLTVSQWANESGITRSAIEKRLDQMGWPVERAVSVPMRSDRRREAKEQ